MRKTSPELIAAILILIGLIAIPIVLGIGVTKIYRIFRPIVEEDVVGIAAVGENTGDGFFKMAFLGWLICGPIYYWAYLEGYFGQW